MFETPEEHEIAVATDRPSRGQQGHDLRCAACGAWFRTTDWPPAVCPDCRRPRPSEEPS